MNNQVKIYKNRFGQLLESQMGDVKPIVIEQKNNNFRVNEPARSDNTRVQGIPTAHGKYISRYPVEGVKADPHSILTVLSLSALIIPVVGPFISAGLQLLDAHIYLEDGDTKSAGLSALFALLPGAGPLLSKLGLGQISKSVMNSIVSKLSKGQKLAPNEAKIVNTLAANKELVEQELSNYSKQLANQTVNKVQDKTSKSILTKVAKGGLKFAGTLAAYGGVAVGYDKAYDMMWDNNRANPINQLSQPTEEDYKAAREIKW